MTWLIFLGWVWFWTCAVFGHTTNTAHSIAMAHGSAAVAVVLLGYFQLATVVMTGYLAYAAFTWFGFE